MKDHQNENSNRKGRKRIFLRIFIWFAGILLFLILLLFSAGYFYYGRLVKAYLTETIESGSKGIYKAGIGRIYLDLLTGNINITDFSLVPDTALYDSLSRYDTISPVLLEIHLRKLKIKDFHIQDFIRHRKILIREIHFQNPEVQLFHMRVTQKRTAHPVARNTMLTIPLPKGLEMIRIDKIMLTEGSFTYHDLARDSAQPFRIPAGEILVNDFLVDGNIEGEQPVFNATDIRIMLKEIRLPTQNGLYEIALQSVGLSTREQTVFVTGFSLKPQYNRQEFSVKAGFQTDRMDISVDTVLLKKVDLRSLLLDRAFLAERLDIMGLVVEDYRDKRVESRKGFFPAMPQKLIRSLKNHLKIDSVVLFGGKVTYLEQVHDEPGTIYFDKMEALFLGLTNDSILLNAGFVSTLNLTTYLMGTGKLDANFSFFLSDTNDRFSYSAELGPFDLTQINPMVSKLLPAKILSGKVDRLLVTRVQANNRVARGNLLFYYHDLHVQIDKKEEAGWAKFKTSVVNFAADKLVLSNSNPNRSGKMKTGVILFERDLHKGIINFIWKSTFSGLKSTMGFDSKDQKTIKKNQQKKSK